MVSALIKRGEKYLLLKRGGTTKLYRGQWQFPEGGVKFGESPFTALKREIKEETKLELKDAKYLGNISSVLKEFKMELWHFVRMVYRCEVKGKVKLSRKHKEYKWVEKKDMEKLELLKGMEFKDMKKFL